MANTQQEYREAVTQMFRDADKDKEGIVDKKELAMVLRALGSWEDSQLDIMFEMFDNGDGKIHYEDFTEWLEAETLAVGATDGQQTRTYGELS